LTPKSLNRELAKLKAEADARMFLPRYIARSIRTAAIGVGPAGNGSEFAAIYAEWGLPADVAHMDSELPKLITRIMSTDPRPVSFG